MTICATTFLEFNFKIISNYGICHVIVFKFYCLILLKGNFFCFCFRVMLQLQTILQYFYKPLMLPTFYWFSPKPTININFSFINNYSPHQQFVRFFCKKICIFSITLVLVLFSSLQLRLFLV